MDNDTLAAKVVILTATVQALREDLRLVSAALSVLFEDIYGKGDEDVDSDS